MEEKILLLTHLEFLLIEGQTEVGVKVITATHLLSFAQNI